MSYPEYSHLFVCLMGMGTVFFGLTCLIVLTWAMGCFLKGKANAVPELPASAAAAVPAAPEPNRQELAAAVSAAIAEELGVAVTGIRILSIKKL